MTQDKTLKKSCIFVRNEVKYANRSRRYLVLRKGETGPAVIDLAVFACLGVMSDVD